MRPLRDASIIRSIRQVKGRARAGSDKTPKGDITGALKDEQRWVPARLPIRSVFLAVQVPEQLLEAIETKFFIVLVGYFRDPIGHHQKQIPREKLTRWLE